MAIEDIAFIRVMVPQDRIDTLADICAEWGGALHHNSGENSKLLKLTQTQHHEIREALRPIIVELLRDRTAIGDIKMLLGDLAEDLVDDVAADELSEPARPFHDPGREQ